jgi:hypothetical protein
MLLRLALALTAGFGAFAAENHTSVVDLVKLVRGAIENHDKDADLAKTLHKIKPGERVDYRILDAMETEGAGPKTMAELERLRDLSRDLPAPAVRVAFSQDAIPSVEDQRRIVRETQQIALNYSRSLPDFFCTEVVRRFDDNRGSLQIRDLLEIKLTYFEGKEDYRVLTVNGRANIKPLEEVGGSISKGEFASMLNSIFTGESKAVLQWDHWTTVRKRVAHVFRFTIKPENSSYHLSFKYQGRFASQSVKTGQRGFVYIDRETNQVLRIVGEADGIPKSFPVQYSSTVLDYDFVDVGGRQFLLPLQADVRMSTDRLNTRNMMEFHGYRKFSGESTITFQ